VADVGSDEVIVASVIPYGEADAIVRCFGRQRGRFSAFARGARASRRRFPGLMAPALGTVIVRARRGDMLDLVELDTDTRLMDLARDLRAWGFAGYVIELVERFVPEGAPLPSFFDTVSATVVTLSRLGAQPRVLRAFELRLLDELGVLPDLGDAVDDPGMPVVAYDPARGHLLARATPASVPFSDSARQAAIHLLQCGADEAVALPIDDDVLREVSRIFANWLRRQGVALRSLEVLKQMR
jgi:DNA repair protein RecO (recombination protein O)